LPSKALLAAALLAAGLGATAARGQGRRADAPVVYKGTDSGGEPVRLEVACCGDGVCVSGTLGKRYELRTQPPGAARGPDTAAFAVFEKGKPEAVGDGRLELTEDRSGLVGQAKVCAGTFCGVRVDVSIVFMATTDQGPPQEQGARATRLGVQGARLTRVTPDSLLGRLGLEAGDVVLSVNGQPIRDQNGLDRALARSAGTARLEVVDVRSGKRLVRDVSLPGGR
jgi:hypothetical protein